MILVFVEQREKTLKKVAFEALLIGCKIADKRGEELAAVLVGSQISGVAGEIARFGVNKVITVDDPVLENYTSDGYSDVVAGLARKREAGVVVFSATAMGKDLAAAVAAKLETQLLQDCISVELDENGAVVATRPIYAGKALSRITAREAKPLVISMRPRAVGPQPEADRGATVVAADLKPPELRSRVAEIVKVVRETVELTEAEVIVSGGRGLKGPENFALLEKLAKAIGAAVGASRAAVDAGWRDHQDQVGQTGKVVAPTVYIACGISGAIQHLVGMINSKCIVAVNKDPEANIFKVADYGVVGDLFKVVPLLTEEFKKL